MKKYLLLAFSLYSINAVSQVPEDALRYTWYPQNGTARNLAIGGAMGSLGGDLTAAYVNPAGIGLFKTKEVVITPGFNFINNQSRYRDSLTKFDRNNFSFGPSGVIIGGPTNNNYERKSRAWAIAISQTANFNNRIRYSALNNFSSFAEQFAETFAKSGLSIDEVLNTNSVLPYTVAPALFTYLIDTVTVNGQVIIKAAPEYLLDSGKAVMQSMDKTTRGGKYELAFTFSENIKDKILWGATLGIPLVNYRSTTVFTESDPSGDTSNRFESFTFTDRFRTTGVGANLKLGVIYRPKDFFRLGFAIHTPDIMFLTDTRNSRLETRLENPVSNFAVNSGTFTNNQEGESQYTQTTAWKALLSASYVFREVENVKKQRAFITADVEYVHHRASRFSSANEDPTAEEKAYYKSLNKVVKNDYKGTFNFKVGAEVKFRVVMARLGFAHYTNPYRDPAFKANQTLLSGGIGYRNQGFFVDLAYVHHIRRDVDLPYRLEDRENTFANLRQQQGQVMATVGVKF